jgi:hypothetical protein
LSCKSGWYDRPRDYFHFAEDAYVLSEKQEMWADSIFYNRPIGKSDLYRNIQMLDTTRSLLVFGDEAHLLNEEEATVTRNPSIAYYETQEDENHRIKYDTLFLRADTLKYISMKNPVLYPPDTLQSAVDSSSSSRQLAVDSSSVLSAVSSSSRQFSVDSSSVQLAVDSVQLAVDSSSVQSAVDSVQLAVDSTQSVVPVGTHGRASLPDSIPGQPPRPSGTPPEEGNPFSVPRSPFSVPPDSIPVPPDSIPILSDTANCQLPTADSIPVPPSPFPVLPDTADSLLPTADCRLPTADSIPVPLSPFPVLPDAANCQLPTADSIPVLPSPFPVLPDTADSLPPTAYRQLPTGFTVLDSLQKDLRRLRMEIPKKTPSPVVSAMFARKPAADSSITETAPAPDSVLQYLYAYRSVKIYRSDGQAMCDSMVFFVNDTLTEMFHNPVLWAENHQISSDKVRFISKDSALHHAEFLGAAFIISEEDTMYYDQIKSRDMFAYFRNNEVYLMDIIANVQTVFFGDEDSVLVNINFAESASMKIFIANRKVAGVRYYESIKNDMHPIEEMPREKQRLKGFAWHDALRPKTRYDVCTRAVKPSRRAAVATLTRPTFPITKKIDAIK